MTHRLMCLNTHTIFFATRVWVEVIVSLFGLRLSPLIILALMHWGIPGTTHLFFNIILSMKRAFAKQRWQPMRTFSPAKGDKLEEETVSRLFWKAWSSLALIHQGRKAVFQLQAHKYLTSVRPLQVCNMYVCDDSLILRNCNSNNNKISSVISFSLRVLTEVSVH